MKIDDTELDGNPFVLQSFMQKYLKYQSKFSLLLKKAEDDYDVLAKDKWEYYTGKAIVKVSTKRKPFDIKVLRQDVDKYIKEILS